MGGLGVGKGLWRGTRVWRGGSVKRTPACGVLLIGQVVRSWLRRDWAPSRAVLVRASLIATREAGDGVTGGRTSGFASWARR